MNDDHLVTPAEMESLADKLQTEAVDIAYVVKLLRLAAARMDHLIVVNNRRMPVSPGRHLVSFAKRHRGKSAATTSPWTFHNMVTELDAASWLVWAAENWREDTDFAASIVLLSWSPIYAPPSVVETLEQMLT